MDDAAAAGGGNIARQDDEMEGEMDVIRGGDRDPWAGYLAMLGDRATAFWEWYNSRPEAIQDLIRRYPPGSWTTIEGRKAHVVSYHEKIEGGAAGLGFSHADPGEDYDGAMASRFFVCGDHIQGEEG